MFKFEMLCSQNNKRMFIKFIRLNCEFHVMNKSDNLPSIKENNIFLLFGMVMAFGAQEDVDLVAIGNKNYYTGNLVSKMKKINLFSRFYPESPDESKNSTNNTSTLIEIFFYALFHYFRKSLEHKIFHR